MTDGAHAPGPCTRPETTAEGAGATGIRSTPTVRINGAAMPSGLKNPLKAVDDKAMDLASADQELKAALFRFVDVVPACRNLDDLARHLTGFLEEVDDRPPSIQMAIDFSFDLVNHVPSQRAGSRPDLAIFVLRRETSQHVEKI